MNKVKRERVSGSRGEKAKNVWISQWYKRLKKEKEKYEEIQWEIITSWKKENKRERIIIKTKMSPEPRPRD